MLQKMEIKNRKEKGNLTPKEREMEKLNAEISYYDQDGGSKFIAIMALICYIAFSAYVSYEIPRVKASNIHWGAIYFLKIIIVLAFLISGLIYISIKRKQKRLIVKREELLKTM